MRTLLAVAFVVFPLLILMLSETVPRWLVITVFGLLAAARVLLLQTLPLRYRTLGSIGIACFCLLAVLGPELTVLKTYPVLMSLAGASYGLYTLAHPPSAIERLARAAGMTVDAQGERYTRGVTQVWIGFLLFNSCIAAGTALFGSTAQWSLYNGLISYILMALLFAAEYGYRGYYRRQQRLSS